MNNQSKIDFQIDKKKRNNKDAQIRLKFQFTLQMRLIKAHCSD